MSAPWRGPRTYIWIALIAVGAAVIALVTWIRPSNAALDQVHVVPAAMSCGGKSVDYRIMNSDNSLSDEAPFSAFRLAAASGTECVLKVAVSSTGQHQVKLNSVDLPGMGPDASPMLRAVKLYESDAGPKRLDDMTDISFPLDRIIEPDSTVILHLELTYGADKIDCRSENYIETWRDLPEVNVSSKGRNRTVEGEISLVIQGKGSDKQNGCG